MLKPLRMIMYRVSQGSIQTTVLKPSLNQAVYVIHHYALRGGHEI